MNTKAIPVAIQAVIRDRYPGKDGRIDRRILEVARKDLAGGGEGEVNTFGRGHGPTTREPHEI